MLGELAAEDKPDRDPDAVGCDGGLPALSNLESQTCGLRGQLLDDAADGGVRDGHVLGGDAMPRTARSLSSPRRHPFSPSSAGRPEHSAGSRREASGCVLRGLPCHKCAILGLKIISGQSVWAESRLRGPRASAQCKRLLQRLLAVEPYQTGKNKTASPKKPT